MANKHRGEVKVTLDGVEYTMRPTFEALISIEDDLNKKLVSIARAFFQSDIGVKETAHIIHRGIESSGAQLSLEAVGRAVVKGGVNNYIKPIVNFLTEGLGGEDKGKGEEAETEE